MEYIVDYGSVVYSGIQEIESPFGFPLRFEGAWVPYKAEKNSCFVQKNGVGTPVLVEKISV